jgi:hypothetical protein
MFSFCTHHQEEQTETKHGRKEPTSYMYTTAPTSDVVVHLSIYHQCNSLQTSGFNHFAHAAGFTSQPPPTANVLGQGFHRHHHTFEAPSSLSSLAPLATFEVEYRVSRDSFSDWDKFTDILVEEVGLYDFRVTNRRVRADAIAAASGQNRTQQQTLLNALLIERRPSEPTSPSSLPAADGASPSPRLQRNGESVQLWLRVNHLHQQQRSALITPPPPTTTTTTTTTDGQSPLPFGLPPVNPVSRNSISTQRQWNEVVRRTIEHKKELDNSGPVSVSLEVDLLSVTIVSADLRAPQGLGKPPAASGGFGMPPAASGAFGLPPAASGGFGMAPAASGAFSSAVAGSASTAGTPGMAPAASGGFGMAPAAPGGFGAPAASGGFGTAPAASGAFSSAVAGSASTAGTPAPAPPASGGFGSAFAGSAGGTATPAPAPLGLGKAPAASGGFGSSFGGYAGGSATPAPAPQGLGKAPS